MLSMPPFPSLDVTVLGEPITSLFPGVSLLVAGVGADGTFFPGSLIVRPVLPL
jgi:hypothetical protein